MQLGTYSNYTQKSTATKLFLSAAFHIPVLGKMDERPVQRSCSTRLLSEHTSDAQLKQDGEELWTEAMALGGNEIAVGFPGGWWYRN
jgi:hypothetical protein